jgi:hypothetical protein
LGNILGELFSNSSGRPAAKPRRGKTLIFFPPKIAASAVSPFFHLRIWIAEQGDQILRIFAPWTIFLWVGFFKWPKFAKILELLFPR